MGEMQRSALDCRGRRISTAREREEFGLKHGGMARKSTKQRAAHTSSGSVNLTFPSILPAKSKQTRPFSKNAVGDSDTDGRQLKSPLSKCASKQPLEPTVPNCRRYGTGSPSQATKQIESYRNDSKSHSRCPKLDMFNANSQKLDIKGNLHHASKSTHANYASPGIRNVIHQPSRYDLGTGTGKQFSQRENVKSASSVQNPGPSLSCNYENSYTDCVTSVSSTGPSHSGGRLCTTDQRNMGACSRDHLLGNDRVISAVESNVADNSVASQDLHLNECRLDSEPALLMNHVGLSFMSRHDPVEGDRIMQQSVHYGPSLPNHFHHENSLFLSRSPNSVPIRNDFLASSIAGEPFNRTTHFVGQTRRDLLTGTYSNAQSQYGYLSTGFPREDSGGFISARVAHTSFVPMINFGEALSTDQLNVSGFSATQPCPTLPYGVFIDHAGFLPCVMAQPSSIISGRHFSVAPDLNMPSRSTPRPSLIVPHRNQYMPSFQQSDRASNRGSMLNNDTQEQNPAQQTQFYSTMMNYQHRLTLESCLCEILATLEHIEGLTYEQIMMLEETVLEELGLHDQYRDMRLDVDNMSYEELLALGERIGMMDVGLSEEIISKSIRKVKYASSAGTVSSGLDDAKMKCSICQEEFEDADELGMLDCQHSYHVACIELWLSRKNQCPICKSSAC